MRVRPLRASVVIAVSGALAWWLARAAASTGATGVGNATLALEGLVTAAVLGCGAVAAGAIAATTLLALAQSVGGGRARAADALPAPLRRFVTGVTVGALLAISGPAIAEEAYPGWVSASAAPSASPTLEPGAAAPSPSPAQTSSRAAAPPPDAPASAPAASPPRGGEREETARRTTARASTHVVARGDSLWRITARLLGPGASNADIARAWPMLYDANRRTIGDDPGLIVPGQVLTIPSEVAR